MISRRFRLGRRVVRGIAYQLGFPANKFYQMNRETNAEVGPTVYPRGCLFFAPDSPNLAPIILPDPLLAARSALRRTWILETYNSTFRASDLSLHRINGGGSRSLTSDLARPVVRGASARRGEQTGKWMMVQWCGLSSHRVTKLEKERKV